MTPATATRPNVVLILADDMGFSDIGCYGSEITTPNLDSLGAAGVRMSNFYNTARCSPSRASLLTGLHPHQTGIGILTNDDGPTGYPGTLNDRCVTIAEVLSSAGYETAIRGKWHLTGHTQAPNGAWPTERGFDSFYGILAGAGSYYEPVTLTDNTHPVDPGDDFYLTATLGTSAADYITNHHARWGSDKNFFLYLPFTAPHWPLHAPEEVIAHYAGVYEQGWDQLRQRRYRSLVQHGIITDTWPPSDRDPQVVAWNAVQDKTWQARRMAVYAAQVELMDQAVGQVIDALKSTGQLNDTLVIFLSDNGGCAEEMEPSWVDELDIIPYNNPTRTKHGERVRKGNDPSVWPGGPATFASYGRPWANLSNTPFREYKHWVHEGGIATPLIAYWPNGNLKPRVDPQPHQLPDVMATILDATATTYPDGHTTTRQGYDRDVLPLEGLSMLPSWRGHNPASPHTLYFEHEGNCALRLDSLKLVRKYGQPWELYDLDHDRAELHNLANDHPQHANQMAKQWQAWADRCGVKPRTPILKAHPQPGSRSVSHEYLSSHAAGAPLPGPRDL